MLGSGSASASSRLSVHWLQPAVRHRPGGPEWVPWLSREVAFDEGRLAGPAGRAAFKRWSHPNSFFLNRPTPHPGSTLLSGLDARSLGGVGLQGGGWSPVRFLHLRQLRRSMISVLQAGEATDIRLLALVLRRSPPLLPPLKPFRLCLFVCVHHQPFPIKGHPASNWGQRGPALLRAARRR